MLALQIEKKLIRDILKISLPAVMDLLAQTLLSFFDMLMVASLGAAAVSAVGLGMAPVMAIFPIFMALGIGTTAILSRAYGAYDREEGKKVEVQGLFICIPLAFLIVALMLWKTDWILEHVGRAKDLDFRAAKEYYQMAVLGVFVVAFNIVFFAFFRSIGKTKIPMLINSVSIFVNIFFNWIFIFVLRMGVFGAAIATFLSRTFVLFCCSYLIFWSKKYWVSLDWKDLKLDLPMASRILKIGIPAAIEQLFLRFGMLFFEMMVISLGNVSYAAHKIASNAESFSFNLGFGFSIAASTLVGQQLGKNAIKKAEYNAKVSTWMAIFVMSCFAILFFSFPEHIISLFTKERDLKSLAAGALRIVSFCQPFLAISMVLSGALRGAGETKSVLYITFIGIFLIRLPLTYFFLHILKTGLLGAWWVMTIDLACRSMAFYYVFRKGKWKYIQV